LELLIAIPYDESQENTNQPHGCVNTYLKTSI